MLIPLPIQGRAGSAISDIAHAPLFGCITLAVLFLWHRMQPLDSFGLAWMGRMFVVGTLVFLLGILIEFAQMMTGRDAAVHDVVANGLGILASLLLCFAWLDVRYQKNRRFLSVIALGFAVLMIGIALAAPVRIGLDVLAGQRSFPLIASFEREMELTRWYFDDCRGELTIENVTHGQRAMRIFLDRAPHPAATLIETVTDWSAVQSLELDVILASSYPVPIEVILKVIDQEHLNYDTDVARKTFQLKPGEPTHLVLHREEMIHGPDTRTLDLSRIKFVSILVVAPKMATFIDIDYLVVRLD